MLSQKKRKKENHLNDSPLTHNTPASSAASASPSSSSSSPSTTTFTQSTKDQSELPSDLDQWLDLFESWSGKERLIALDNLIANDICDPDQIRYIYSLIEPQLQRDFISLLPKELALHILHFLEPSDLIKAAQTCRTWRILCEDNLLWREKCQEIGLFNEGEFLCASSGFIGSSPSSLSAHENPNNIPFYRSDYKKGYLKSRSIEFNWRYGVFPVDPEEQQPNQVQQQPDQQPNQVQQPDQQLNQVQQQPDQQPNQAQQQPDQLGPSPSLLGQPHSLLGPPHSLLGPPHSLLGPQHSLLSSQFSQQLQRLERLQRLQRFCSPLPASQNLQPDPKVTSPKQKILKEILHLKGHDDHVVTCLQFNPQSNLIVSGSDDNTLKVWSSVTGKCLRTLSGHAGGVWSSQLSPNNILISGSTDRTLRVWEALTGECKFVLYGHTSTVRCMALHEDLVVSGSRDTTLRVWNINTGDCCHVLTGHQAAVRCVQFNGKLIVSGAYDYNVKVWDPKTESCLHTLKGHENRVYSLQFDGENIVSGSLDTTIRVWSASAGSLKHTLTGHQSLTSGMQLRGNILVSGNADSTVKVWDINTGECLQTLAGENKHKSAVTCLQFNSKFVITSSDDGTIKLWDLSTGEFIRNLISVPSAGLGGVVWRIRASHAKLVCAVGSRNGTEETRLLVLDFDTDDLPSLPSNDTKSLVQA